MKSPVIDYAISTVPRKVNYIDLLLANLDVKTPVHLFVCGNKTDYLNKFKNSPSVQIHTPSQEEWLRFKDCSVFHRATWNYWRCMSSWPANPNRSGLLILEDDVLPARGWLQWLSRAIHEIESICGNKFAIALYSGRDFSKQNLGGIFARYPTHQFAGTQGVYYSEALRVECADFLKLYGVEWNEAPYDMLVADYMSRRDYPILVTVPSIIQHMGEVSTGLSNFHQAPNFKKSLC